MNDTYNRLDRLVWYLEDFLAVCAAVILVIVTFSVCVDVVLRYAFNRPLVWVTEVTEYALVYIAFLGAAWAQRRDAHVNVDVFFNLMSPSWQAICQFISHVLGFVVFLVLTIYGAHAAIDALVRGLYKPTTLQIPAWIVLVAIPLGSIVIALRFAFGAFTSMRAWRDGRRLTHRAYAGVE